jgi:ABC-type nitrate/sulfonate/bicarbonate transport system substrate-binding protein
MRTRVSWALCMLVAALLVGGCKQKEQGAPEAEQTVTIKLGHVGHDHHTALYVALDRASDYRERAGIDVKAVEDRKFYQFLRHDEKIADVRSSGLVAGRRCPRRSRRA